MVWAASMRAHRRLSCSSLSGVEVGNLSKKAARRAWAARSRSSARRVFSSSKASTYSCSLLEGSSGGSGASTSGVEKSSSKAWLPLAAGRWVSFAGVAGSVGGVEKSSSKAGLSLALGRGVSSTDGGCSSGLVWSSSSMAGLLFAAGGFGFGGLGAAGLVRGAVGGVDRLAGWPPRRASCRAC